MIVLLIQMYLRNKGRIEGRNIKVVHNCRYKTSQKSIIQQLVFADGHIQIGILLCEDVFYSHYITLDRPKASPSKS